MKIGDLVLWTQDPDIKGTVVKITVDDDGDEVAHVYIVNGEWAGTVQHFYTGGLFLIRA
tara:strand:- start:544 stop:720 length:177 start_codon:yes stop_codon:yes gene_type:complete